jgi:hypothetical protein
MSRTWKRDDSGRKARGDTLRDKRRNKYSNTHRDDAVNPDSYDRMKLNQEFRRNSNPDYGLDSDMD